MQTMIRSVLAACLLVGAASIADETDPLLRLEHGLWLQEVQWDVTSAMKEYQAVINTPGAPGRVLAEARFHLADCYLEKDSPSAALALFQTIVRLHSDVTPFGRLASERITETSVLIDRMPALPSRHVGSRLAERLVILKAALRAGEQPLVSTLLDGMSSDLLAQREELSLVPANEPPVRAAQRAEAVALLESRMRTMRELMALAGTGDLERARKLVDDDVSLGRLLDFGNLWPGEGDWARLVAAERRVWITALSQESAADAQEARAALVELLQPVAAGPRGNPEVQTALRTLEMMQNLEPLVRIGNWAAVRQQLASELTLLYGRYGPAATVRPPNAGALNAAMLTQLVTVLTHVVEAVSQIDKTSRVERVSASIDLALQTAKKLTGPWKANEAAFRRLQETISQLERAKTEAQIDLQRARRLLRAEVYD